MSYQSQSPRTMELQAPQNFKRYLVAVYLIIGIALFSIQVYGIAALIDNMRKATVRKYVLAPASALRSASETSIEEDDPLVTTDPANVADPNQIIDTFDVACVSFGSASRNAIKVALVCGIVQVVFNILIVNGLLATTLFDPHYGPFTLLRLLLDVAMLTLLAFLFRTFNGIIERNSDSAELCLPTESTDISGAINLSIILWMTYVSVYVFMYPALHLLHK